MVIIANGSKRGDFIPPGWLMETCRGVSRYAMPNEHWHGSVVCVCVRAHARARARACVRDTLRLDSGPPELDAIELAFPRLR